MTPRARRLALAALASLALFGLMYGVIADTGPWQRESYRFGLGESPQQLDATTDGLFREHVLAFEALGILLTAAMIGALVIARPLTGRPDAENYVQPTREQMQESVHQSAVTTHFPEAKA